MAASISTDVCLLRGEALRKGFGTLFGFGLYLIGVPNPTLWEWSPASCGFAVRWTLLAATLPLALSLAVFDGWLRPLLLFLLVGALELIIGNFVEPWLYGAYVGISSLALLVSAFFGAFCGKPQA